ncbi:hypothetical protein NL676_012838 [Syzygium grande]|nr:hypothetical protein NL676_012838 [Syzygium grande]
MVLALSLIAVYAETRHELVVGNRRRRRDQVGLWDVAAALESHPSLPPAPPRHHSARDVAECVTTVDVGVSPSSSLLNCLPLPRPKTKQTAPQISPLSLMQKAIPRVAYIPASSGGPRPPAVEGQAVLEGMAATTSAVEGGSGVGRAVVENAVIVIGRRGCCMCHVAERLLLGLGVNPAVYEVDDVDEGVVVKELVSMIRINGKDGKDSKGGEGSDNDQKLQFPAVFVGGQLFGGLEKVIATHISGELVPILREAGALWL